MERVRYLNKDVNVNERENYSRWWREQIEHFGTKVHYYTHGYTLSGHDFIYGEDPTSAFTKHGPVVMLTDITNDAIMLSKFGIMADCDMTAVVHISSYYDTFGSFSEPKAGDLIELSEYGGSGDRPNGRGAPIYEITERDDQNLQFNANTLMGHYIWVIKCKRWEYSSEPGTEPEPLNIQINDNGEHGLVIDTATLSAQQPAPYPPDSADKPPFCVVKHNLSDVSEPYGYFDGPNDIS
jgi:hypothetical protein